MGMSTKEIAKEVDGRGRIAHLAEHPARGFVHQVVGMVEVNLGIAEAP